MFPTLLLFLAAWQKTFDPELVHCPPASDAARFPCPAECWYQERLWTTHRNYLATLRDNGTVAVAPTGWRERFEAWDMQCAEAIAQWQIAYSIKVGGERSARLQLDRYRYLIGRDAYDGGHVPPSLPATADHLRGVWKNH